jgi:CysZ protein
VILRAFLLSLGQIADGRFLRVLLIGVALSLALLIAVYAGFLYLLIGLTPDTIDLPWVGPTTRVHELLGAGSLLLMIGLSVFLMVPVAAVFTALFFDDVAAAVEARHYPALPPVPRQRLSDGLIASVNFFGVLIAVNLLALILYAFVGPFAPLMFWAVNGWLLGREYFQTAAMRRHGRDGARALYRANRGRAWRAGMLMAAPLSLPFVNLLIPVLGAATFTHLVQITARP